MKFIRANEVAYDQLQDFLLKNDNVNGKKLLKAGYVALIHDEIIGCFIFESVDAGGSYWLKQLYIIRKEAGKLPVLLEGILHLAKEQDVKHVHVHSHQPVVDVLLEALQFCPQKERKYAFQQEKMQGNWWTYSVS